jgi:hypothetical protein
MYKISAVKTISESVTEVILKKFRIYIEDRKNDVSIQEEIDKEIDFIDELEDLALTISNKYSIPKRKGINNYLNFAGYYFKYDENKEEFVFENDKKEYAKSKVLRDHGLSWLYPAEGSIVSRIKAIISTVEASSFDDILDYVEKNIDFNEFIELNKPVESNN